MFLNDVRGGLSIIRHVPGPIAVLVCVVAAIDFALDPRNSTGLQRQVAQDFLVEYQEIGLALLFAIMIAAMLVPVFYAVEVARIGAARRGGLHVRARYFPSFRLVWVCILLSVLSLLALIFAAIAIFFLTIIIQAISPKVLLLYPSIEEFIPIGVPNARIVVYNSGSILVSFLGLTAIVFVVSRFALIPIMIWNQGLSFRAAWRRQIDVFDRYEGSARARFFWILLVLTVFAAGLDQVSGMVPLDGWAIPLLVVPVSFILLVVLPVAILTHMVLCHPVLEHGADDATRKNDEALGEGK